MLTRLAISNFATIESLAVEFLDGFSVLTGETGAGKSILIGALRLVLGARAAPDQIRTGATQTWVEATFDLRRMPEVRAQLDELGVPAKDELVVRRSLQDSGRSRAVANDCSISQAKLEDIGAYLVNIHGQHDNQMLLDNRTHVDFLDAFGGLLPQRAELKATHGRYHTALHELRQLEQKVGRQDALRQELQDQVAELESARLQAGEDTALRQSLQRLSHVEELAGLTHEASNLLSEGEGALLVQLQKLAHLMAQGAALDPTLVSLHSQLAAPHIQLGELYRALNAYTARLEPDPGGLERAQARLAELEKIQRRYGGSVAAAMRRLETAKIELDGIGEIGGAVVQAKAGVTALAAQLHAQALALSQRRTEAAVHLDGQIERQLNELGMNKARFETRIGHPEASIGMADAITATGMDRVEFLLSTNPGQSPRPLAKIASGGELSRTMLAMKTVLADVDPTRTLIFDEVDAGIGGAVAEIVGNKLRALGTGRQVLCITHLPQIAAQGQHHLRVSKTTDGVQTYTKLLPLGESEKVREVARLLSGVTVTAQSLASAEEMVHRAGRAPG